MDKTAVDNGIVDAAHAMENGVSLNEFVASGRTGRRNALPDILNAQHASVGTGGLAEGLEKLNCSDGTKGGNAGEHTKSPASNS